MMRRATDKGFSAIELAMVMLIITIVTGVVIFVGKGARDKARATSCLSNLDEIALAGAMYAADNDGFYPRREPFVGLSPYIKNVQIMRCPASSQRPNPDRDDNDISSDDRQTSAGFIRLGGYWGQIDYYFVLGLSSDERPDTILAYDDVPDRHGRRRFNMVRIDGAAKKLPADRWPGVPQGHGHDPDDLPPEPMMPIGRPPPEPPGR